jgi:hypothetical protein
VGKARGGMTGSAQISARTGLNPDVTKRQAASFWVLRSAFVVRSTIGT